jgi:hypothetical protein
VQIAPFGQEGKRFVSEISEKNHKMSFLEALPDIAFERVAKLCFAFIYIIISKTQVATSSKPLIIKASRNAKSKNWQGFQKVGKNSFFDLG